MAAVLLCCSSVSQRWSELTSSRQTDASRGRQTALVLNLSASFGSYLRRASLVKSDTGSQHFASTQRKIGEGGGGEFKAASMFSISPRLRGKQGATVCTPLPRSTGASRESNWRDGLIFNSVQGLSHHDRLLRAKVDEKKTYNCEFEHFLYLIL